MALSEREQQLLEEMEQALYAEDPRFATQMKSTPRASSTTRRAIGGIGVLAGLGLVLLGVNTTWIVGVLGFVVMVAALAFAFAPPRKKAAALGSVAADGSVRVRTTGGASARSVRGTATASGKAGRMSRPARGKAGRMSRPARGSRQGSFMERMEQRWDRRRGGW